MINEVIAFLNCHSSSSVIAVCLIASIAFYAVSVYVVETLYAVSVYVVETLPGKVIKWQRFAVWPKVTKKQQFIAEYRWRNTSTPVFHERTLIRRCDGKQVAFILEEEALLNPWQLVVCNEQGDNCYCFSAAFKTYNEAQTFVELYFVDEMFRLKVWQKRTYVHGTICDSQ